MTPPSAVVEAQGRSYRMAPPATESGLRPAAVVLDSMVLPPFPLCRLSVLESRRPEVLLPRLQEPAGEILKVLRCVVPGCLALAVALKGIAGGWVVPGR